MEEVIVTYILCSIRAGDNIGYLKGSYKFENEIAGAQKL